MLLNHVKNIKLFEVFVKGLIDLNLWRSHIINILQYNSFIRFLNLSSTIICYELTLNKMIFIKFFIFISFIHFKELIFNNANFSFLKWSINDLFLWGWWSFDDASFFCIICKNLTNFIMIRVNQFIYWLCFIESVCNIVFQVNFQRFFLFWFD